MTLIVLLIAATAFLAYSNGANDNFKGVATLFGSDTTDYKKALWWATATTFLGGLTSIFLAEKLLVRFSGKGLVPDVLAGSPEFLLAVGIGAGLTVIFATVLGFPISTTHGLTGALAGAGLVAAGSRISFGVLGSQFFLPLLLSPFIAAGLAGIHFFSAKWLKNRLALNRGMTLHIALSDISGKNSLPPLAASEVAFRQISRPEAAMLKTSRVASVSLQSLLDKAHFLSAGLVSFGRGLNDTPKIVALLLALKALGSESGMLIVAIAMAAGGLLNARKVAMTMSRKITPISPLEGFSANLATGLLVLFASNQGLPVSTTHVSVGSLFGIGTLSGKINRKMTGEIVLSWLLTLPVAAMLSAAVYWLIQN